MGKDELNRIHEHLCAYNALLVNSLNEHNAEYLQDKIKDVSVLIRQLNVYIVIVTKKGLQHTYETRGKIAAIKEYRNETGSTLMAAKKAVEDMAADGNWRPSKH